MNKDRPTVKEFFESDEQWGMMPADFEGFCKNNMLGFAESWAAHQNNDRIPNFDMIYDLAQEMDEKEFAEWMWEEIYMPLPPKPTKL